MGPSTRHGALPLARVLLLKLAVLFFVAHPGSAATWADPRAFLLHLRYPNRDLDVPRAFGAMQQRQEQQQRRREQQHPLKQHQQAHGAYGPVGRTPLLFVAPTSPLGRRAASSSGSAVRPLNVVIGSFVSELERSPQDPRRKLVKPMQPQQPQPVPQQQAPVRLPSMGQPQVAMATAQGPSGGHQQQPPPQQRGGGGGGASGFSIPLPLPVPQQLLKRSAASLVEAYDGVLSFVGSRLVTTEQTLSKALGSVSALTAAGSSSVGSSLTGVEPAAKEGQQSSSSSSSMAGPASSLSSAAQRYDLVGFLDLDPFERSKRHFKRNASLSKMLL